MVTPICRSNPDSSVNPQSEISGATNLVRILRGTDLSSGLDDMEHPWLALVIGSYTDYLNAPNPGEATKQLGEFSNNLEKLDLTKSAYEGALKNIRHLLVSEIRHPQNCDRVDALLAKINEKLPEAGEEEGSGEGTPPADSDSQSRYQPPPRNGVPPKEAPVAFDESVDPKFELDSRFTALRIFGRELAIDWNADKDEAGVARTPSKQNPENRLLAAFLEALDQYLRGTGNIGSVESTAKAWLDQDGFASNKFNTAALGGVRRILASFSNPLNFEKAKEVLSIIRVSNNSWTLELTSPWFNNHALNIATFNLVDYQTIEALTGDVSYISGGLRYCHNFGLWTPCARFSVGDYKRLATPNAEGWFGEIDFGLENPREPGSFAGMGIGWVDQDLSNGDVSGLPDPQAMARVHFVAKSPAYFHGFGRFGIGVTLLPQTVYFDINSEESAFHKTTANTEALAKGAPGYFTEPSNFFPDTPLTLLELDLAFSSNGFNGVSGIPPEALSHMLPGEEAYLLSRYTINHLASMKRSALLPPLQTAKLLLGFAAPFGDKGSMEQYDLLTALETLTVINNSYTTAVDAGIAWDIIRRGSLTGKLTLGGIYLADVIRSAVLWGTQDDVPEKGTTDVIENPGWLTDFDARGERVRLLGGLIPEAVLTGFNAIPVVSDPTDGDWPFFVFQGAQIAGGTAMFALSGKIVGLPSRGPGILKSGVRTHGPYFVEEPLHLDDGTLRQFENSDIVAGAGLSMAINGGMNILRWWAYQSYVNQLEHDGLLQDQYPGDLMRFNVSASILPGGGAFVNADLSFLWQYVDKLL
ncbi:MAG: hypothetical protein HYU97_09130 [Deltaproteobacteria bacterium]|nr:hypothetical protein [Deltaproteobacteria bacterium]